MPTTMIIEFKSGDPVSINNRKLEPHILLSELNKIGGDTDKEVILWRIDLLNEITGCLRDTWR